MHFLSKKSNRIVVHNLFRRFYYCNYGYEILYACCERNCISLLFPLFYELLHRRRVILKEMDFSPYILTSLYSLSIWKLEHWEFFIESSYPYSSNREKKKVLF